MNRGVILAVVAFVGYFLVSMVLQDYSVPIYSLPFIGPVVSLNPFEFLAPYTVFIAAGLAILTYFVFQKRGGKS